MEMIAESTGAMHESEARGVDRPAEAAQALPAVQA
jgi:hypothetical protein